MRTFLMLMILLTADHLLANSRGYLANSGEIDDSALICMSIGQTATLTGLDDFVLTTNGLSGQPGSNYQGSDQFHLESNGAVRVNIVTEGLFNGSEKITPLFKLDATTSPLNTTTDEAHSSDHTLSAEVILGAISAQHAGEYSGEVTLTVVPQLGGGGGCGASVVTYPKSVDYNGTTNSEWATIAYEDLYPNPGDADYNDMVLQFRIEEHYNAQNQLETVDLDFIPVARGAGYNHRLYLSLDGLLNNSKNVTYQSQPAIIGSAKVKVSYKNLTNGNQHSAYFDVTDDLPIFHNTRATLAGFANVYEGSEYISPKSMTSVSISLDNPELNLGNSGLSSGAFFYRPSLYVMNTRNDIDLAEVNPNDGMIDSNGYPFGVIVPADWRWPLERVNINDAYPLFSEYRSWLSGESDTLSDMAENWYDYPTSGAEGSLIWGGVTTPTNIGQ